MKDLTVYSHACHKTKSSDLSHAGRHSRPQCGAGDVAAGAFFQAEFQRE